VAAAWVLPLIGVIDGALGLIRDERSKARINRVAKLKKEIMEEDALGYDSDDAKIEHLEKELIIEAEAVASELALYNSKPQ